jgi:3-phytase
MLHTISTFLCFTAVCTLALAAPLPEVTIKEVFFTTDQSRENIDSPALWIGGNGEKWLFATSKEGHSVNVFDALNGAMKRRLGGLGVELGQFNRPNGIWVEDDLLWVVERDNRRVQVFGLPDLLPIATFGDAQLRKPYGLYVRALESGVYDVYVTDSYESESGELPPDAELDQRIHRFRFEREGNSAEGEWTAAYGVTEGAGRLFVVESIFGDPAHNQLLVAEELEDDALGRQVKVYDLDGNFSGKTFGQGIFSAQVEGIALYETGEKSGYWIVTDQGKVKNLFHVFARGSFEYLGVFEGERTLNTDGIWLSSTSLPRFPAGVFYACDNDRAISAFDLKEIFEALGLPL